MPTCYAHFLVSWESYNAPQRLTSDVQVHHWVHKSAFVLLVLRDDDTSGCWGTPTFRAQPRYP